MKIWGPAAGIYRGFLHLRFLCPLCREFNTAVNPRTNLGRCFRCEQNFNPIDMVMIVKGYSFLQAVEYLSSLL